MKINKKDKIFYNLLARLQNWYFKLNSPNLCNKNRILFIGNMRQSLPILKELKKNPKNVIIRAGDNVGRGFFNKYADFYVTFKKLSKKEKIGIIKSRVDIVVTLNDILPFERGIVEMANKFNIPTLTGIHGILSDNLIKKRETVFLNFLTDKMFIFSESQKQRFIEKGIQSNRLEVTGCPWFDNYFNEKSPMTKEDVYKKLKIPKEKNMVLFVEEYLREEKGEFLDVMISLKQHMKRYVELFNVIKEIPNIHLVIKPHPSGFVGEPFIDDLKAEIGVNNFTVANNIDIYSLINASTVLIMRLSTVGLEAMILKKPIIIFDTYSHTLDYFDYTEFGAALHAKKPGDLKKVLKRLLEDKSIQVKLQNNMKKFVNKHYIGDGKASKRVANLIEVMIKTKYKGD